MWIWFGQIGTGTGISPGTTVLPCQHHSTSVPYPYVIHLVLKVYNLSNCQRHRNIFPSLGEDAKNYDAVVKTAETELHVRHTLPIEHLCSVLPLDCKLPAAAIRHY